MKITLSTILLLSCAAMAIAQAPAPPAPAPAPPGRGGAPRLSFWVTSSAWADGGMIPMKHSGRGDNKSPAFEFHWNLGTNPGTAPDTLKTYAVILHETENSSSRTTTDTLHWSAFNIPGTATGLAEV